MEAYRERSLTNDDQWGVENGDALGRRLEGLGLGRQNLNAIGELGGREGGHDRRRNESDASDEGAQGNHFCGVKTGVGMCKVS